jgi:hypothetical protein
LPRDRIRPQRGEDVSGWGLPLQLPTACQKHH